MKNIITICLLAALIGLAHAAESEKPHLDAILKRGGPPTPEQIQALDLTGPGAVPDGQVDVRDLVLFLDGLPVAAYFETEQTVAFRDDTSVPVVIRFSKPATGNIRVSLGGTASAGSDFLEFENPVPNFEGLTTAINVDGEITRTLNIPLAPTKAGYGGESRLVLNLMAEANLVQGAGTVTVDRHGGISPGYRSSHTIIIRDAAKSWTGTILFDPHTTFRPRDVRFLMDAQGATRILIADSVMFAGTSAFTAYEGENGQIVFSSPITGEFALPGQSGEVNWSLSLEPLPVDPSTPSGIADYEGILTLNDFPYTGLVNSSVVTLTLMPSIGSGD